MSRIFHLILSVVLNFGGIYHAFMGSKTLEEFFHSLVIYGKIEIK